MIDPRQECIQKREDILRRLAANKVARSSATAALAAINDAATHLGRELSAINAELSHHPKPAKIGKREQPRLDRLAAVADMYRRHALVPSKTMTAEQSDAHHTERREFGIGLDDYNAGVRSARDAAEAAAS